MKNNWQEEKKEIMKIIRSDIMVGFNKDLLNIEQTAIDIIEIVIQNLLKSQEKEHKKSIKLLTEIFDNKMDSLLKEQRESPMGVSQWKKHGKKHGYWEYFKKEQREKAIKMIEETIDNYFKNLIIIPDIQATKIVLREKLIKSLKE